MREIEDRRGERPDLILEGWSQVVDDKWKSMTQTISFEKGVLVVKVRSAALYSLLVQQEQARLLRKMQEKFPMASLKKIIFRIG